MKAVRYHAYGDSDVLVYEEADPPVAVDRAAGGPGRRRRSLRQHHHPRPEDAGRGVRPVRVFVRSDASQLAELVARIDAGVLQIEVAERRPLTDLAAAGRLPARRS